MFELKRRLDRLKRIAAQEPSDSGGALIDDPLFRRKLAELEIDLMVLETTAQRIHARARLDEGMRAARALFSIDNITLTERLDELALEAAGPYAVQLGRDLGGGGPDCAAGVVADYFNRPGFEAIMVEYDIIIGELVPGLSAHALVPTRSPRERSVSSLTTNRRKVPIGAFRRHGLMRFSRSELVT